VRCRYHPRDVDTLRRGYRVVDTKSPSGSDSESDVSSDIGQTPSTRHKFWSAELFQTTTITVFPTMVRTDAAPGTLVYITGGAYLGWVGRIDRHTAARVWIDFLEDNHRQPVQGTGMIDPTNCIRLLARHERAGPYPELRSRTPTARRGRAPPLRRAVMNLIIAHAEHSADYTVEITSIINELTQRLLHPDDF
jgi:hypothetical protein